MIDLRLRLPDLAGEFAHLRIGLADLLLNRLGLLHLRLGLPHLRFRLAPIGCGRVYILLRRRLMRQRLLALIIGFGLDEICIGAGELRLRHRESGGKILARDFGGIFDARQLALRGGERRLGLLLIDQILARIDMDDRIALMDELIVAEYRGKRRRRKSAARS